MRDGNLLGVVVDQAAGYHGAVLVGEVDRVAGLEGARHAGDARPGAGDARRTMTASTAPSSSFRLPRATAAWASQSSRVRGR